MTLRPINDAAACFCRSGTSNLIILLCVIWVLNGCAGWLRPVEHDATALKRVTRWTDHNATLEHFKALLQVQIRARGQAVNGRAAIAGAIPDRLRLEFLSFIGQPILRIAGDGRTITLINIQEDSVHQMDQTESALEKIIGMPLSVQHLIDVLLGRPPIPDFAAAIRGQSQCAVQLQSRWYKLLADINSEGCEQPESMILYSAEGQVQLTIRWLQWQTIQGYEIPRKVLITSVDGAHIDFTIERFWPDTPLPPSTFVLEPDL